MIEAKKIKSTSNADEVFTTINEIAKDMNVNAELVLALTRLGDSCTMPIIRGDVNTADVIAILTSIVKQEQRGELPIIDWKKIIMEVIPEMDSAQRLRLLGETGEEEVFIN